jgi:hypothetical protein
MTKDIRPISIQGKIAHVPLTKGYTAIIDADDVLLACGYNWTAQVMPRTVYAYRIDYSGAKARKVYLHRALMGEPKGLEVDHIDANGMNNTRCNLRKATKSQNCQNSRARTDSSSGIKGVSLHKQTGKWRARMTVDGKKKCLGLFDTIEAAHAARVSAGIEHHGEFGRA